MNRKTAFVLTLALTVLPVLLCSCISYEFKPQPETLRLRLDVPDPSIYIVRTNAITAERMLNEGQGEEILKRDRQDFLLPLAGYVPGLIVVLFIFPIRESDPEEVDYVVISRAAMDLRKLTIAELRKQPRTEDGAYLIPVT